jgi:hypothetical protein
MIPSRSLPFDESPQDSQDTSHRLLQWQLLDIGIWVDSKLQIAARRQRSYFKTPMH